MSISSVGSNVPTFTAQQPKGKTASDGDSAAVEASESAKTKLNEITNGGSGGSPVASALTAPSGGINKLV